MVIPNQIQGPALDQLGNRYQLKREVARNQAASLYQAVEIASGRSVALKVFRQKFSADPRFALNFRNHMRAIYRIESEYLISVLDYGMVDGRYYVASEWINGQDLSSYLAKAGSLSELQAIAIASQVCLALDIIHRNGLLHQNIKPQNILLTAEGRVKLSDTGLSGLISESGLSRTHVMLGRYHYISPEQVKGLDLTPGSDLYSLGIVLYEMLTGKFPFDSRDVWTVLRMHVESEPPPLNQSAARIARPLAKIVQRALHKSPELRFSTAGEMNAALTAVWMDSVPTRDEFNKSSTAEIWGYVKFLFKRGKAFLQRPAPIRLLGKQYAFGIMLLAQFTISFLIVFLFLTGIAMAVRQIRENENRTQESIRVPIVGQQGRKSGPKTKLIKPAQDSGENPISPVWGVGTYEDSTEAVPSNQNFLKKVLLSLEPAGQQVIGIVPVDFLLESR